MKSGMRILRNLVIMAAVVVAAMVVMPKRAWAEGSVAFTKSDGTTEITELPVLKGSASNTIKVKYTLDASNNEKISVTVPDTDILTNVNIDQTSATPPELAASPASITFDASNTNTGDVILTATITGDSGSIKTATCKIKVVDKELSVTPDKSSIGAYETVTLTATGVSPYEIDSTVTWSITSGEEYLKRADTSTTSTATFKGIKAGTATVKAVDGNGAIGTCTLTVTDLGSISLSPSTDYIIYGASKKSTTLTATLPTGAGSSDWPKYTSNSDTSVSLSGDETETCTVTAKNVSSKTTVTITAAKEGMGSGTATITVIPAFLSGTVTANPSTAGTSSTSTITATGTSDTYNKVVFSVPDTTYGSFSGANSIETTNGQATFSASSTATGASGVTITATYMYDTVIVGTATCTLVTKALSKLTLSDVKVTKGYSMPISITPDVSGTYSVTWSPTSSSYFEISGSNTSSGYKLKGTKVSTDGSLTLQGTVGGVSSDTKKVYVYDKPSISYSDNKLTIDELPDSIYTGSDNIDSVSKGVIAIYYDGDRLYKSDASSSYGSTSGSKTLSASDIQSLIEKSDVYNKLTSLDKDSTTLEFRVYGYGNGTTNTDAYGSTDVSVYKITVSGTGINTTKKYAVKGVELKLTATAATGYSSPTWNDGTTSNPRTVTVSGSATYSATGVLGVKNTTNTAAGTGSTANSNLDKVPKTGEAHDVFVMWMILICSCVAAGILLIIQYRAKLVSSRSDKKK